VRLSGVNKSPVAPTLSGRSLRPILNFTNS